MVFYPMPRTAPNDRLWLVTSVILPLLAIEGKMKSSLFDGLVVFVPGEIKGTPV